MTTETSTLTFGKVRMSVSMPEGLDWHMILDQELTQLSASETGILGSVGFVGFGSALGLIPSFIAAIEKVNMERVQFTGGDLAAVLAFAACVVLAVVCLAIFFIFRQNKISLAVKIRTRSKRGFKFSEEPKAGETSEKIGL